MPLFAGDSLDDVYKKLKGRWSTIRSMSLAMRTNSAAGPVSFTDVRNFYERLYSELAACEALISVYDTTTLTNYVRAQTASQSSDPVADYVAMRTAVNAVLNHIASVLPPNSAHTVNAGKVVEPSFPSDAPGIVTLLNRLDTLIGTIRV